MAENTDPRINELERRLGHAPTVLVACGYNGPSYIDVRPYGEDTPGGPLIEVEMVSGNPENDGLTHNLTLARISLESAMALESRLGDLIETILRAAP